MPQKNSPPVIKQALSEAWDTLAPVIKQHYDISPGDPSKIIIKGVMDEVYHSPIAKLFLIPGRIFGALVPYKGQEIPTEVHNWTLKDNSKAMFWHRTLEFPLKPPVIFRSRMEHIKDNEIIEYVKFGMGIRMHVSVKDRALAFSSTGYIWNILGIKLIIPNWLVLGRAEIIEKAISDEEFYVDFNMTHPLFGKTFSYTGVFSIIDHF